MSRLLPGDSGFTVSELLVVLSLSSILMGVAVVNLHQLTKPSESAAAEVAGFMKKARARALSTTSAYTVQPDGSGALIASKASDCSVAAVVDPKLRLELPSHAKLNSTAWSVCFNSRGFPDSNVSLEVEDKYGNSYTIEVFLGGAVRYQ